MLQKIRGEIIVAVTLTTAANYRNSKLTQAEPRSIQAEHWKTLVDCYIPWKWLHWYIIFVPCLFRRKKGNIEIGSIRLSVCLSHFHVRSITLSFIKWIWNNLAQMFVIIRRCVMGNNQTHTSRVKVALAQLRLTLSIWGYMLCPVHYFFIFEGIL